VSFYAETKTNYFSILILGISHSSILFEESSVPGIGMVAC